MKKFFSIRKNLSLFIFIFLFKSSQVGTGQLTSTKPVLLPSQDAASASGK